MAIRQKRSRIRNLSFIHIFILFHYFFLADKRKRDDSPPPPRRKKAKWSTKTTEYKIATSSAVAKKRVVIAAKDVFKIPLDKIEVNPVYQTRDVNTAFVECLKDAMSTDLSLDSVLYVACEEQPFIEDNGCIGNESPFYILGGTHYLSALRKVFQDKTEKCLVNAAIYVDLTEEEILWLGTQHNNKQHQFRQISAQDYILIQHHTNISRTF
ncbi:uncharacterized protein LOC122947199 [Acropora millepora]|uniref:uncharacterized protein LOC122947199 n=1 Tax=Acropora millepora TaxID=45264 RepID=UPI001CF5BA49|nr:uncharacterized protein LOC122947199 [Acropora millepora]